MLRAKDRLMRVFELRYYRRNASHSLNSSTKIGWQRNLAAKKKCGDDANVVETHISSSRSNRPNLTVE
jgi:hypothetical protein